jgi:hypothetical protein
VQMWTNFLPNLLSQRTEHRWHHRVSMAFVVMMFVVMGALSPGCSRANDSESGSDNPTGDASGSSPACTGPSTDGRSCDDGDPCTVDDRCNAAGGCVSGSPRVCEELDGNPCTVAECNATSGSDAANFCVEVPATGLEFSDVCFDYRCDAGVSVVVGDAATNPCASLTPDLDACVSSYTCDPNVADASEERCTPVIHTGECDDGDPCTGSDSCSTGTCAGEQVDCDDGIACTADSCSKASGCVSTPQSTLCDDGNSCTEDTCTVESGCTTVPLDGSDCSDGDPCTVGDSCQNGECNGEAVTTESNVCDGVDNDCDGLTDEDCTLILRGQSLGDGQGAAQNNMYRIRQRLGAPRAGGTTTGETFSVRSGSTKGSVQ